MPRFILRGAYTCMPRFISLRLRRSSALWMVFLKGVLLSRLCKQVFSIWRLVSCSSMSFMLASRVYARATAYFLDDRFLDDRYAHRENTDAVAFLDANGNIFNGDTIFPASVPLLSLLPPCLSHFLPPSVVFVRTQPVFLLISHCAGVFALSQTDVQHLFSRPSTGSGPRRPTLATGAGSCALHARSTGRAAWC